jgi:O-antigen/teichoic acid export membrane protein
MPSFWRSVSTLISGNLIAQGISIASLPVLSRLYLPEEYGYFGFFVACVAVLVVVINGGYEAAIMLPKEAEKAHELVVLSLQLAVVLSVILGLLAWLGGNWVLHWAEVDILYGWHLLIPLSILLEGAGQPLQMAVNRAQNYRLLSFSRVLRAVLTVGVSLYFGLTDGSFRGLILGYIAGQFGNVALLAIHYHRQITPLPWQAFRKRPREAAWQYRDFPTYAILSGWLYTAAKHLPFFLLTRFFQSQVTGQFTKAERILNLPPVLISMPIGKVFYQQATAAWQEGPLALASITRRTFWQLSALGLPILIIVMVWGPALFGFVLGEVWTEAGEYARWLMPWLYLTFIASPLSFLIDIRRKLKAFLWYNLLQFFTRLGALLYGGMNLNALETMQLFGAVGALMVAIQIVYLLYIGFVFKR